MSLILDALRKSEAERRRGQSPDVFGATPGLPAPRASAPRVWPLLLLGAMLLGSAWLIWNAGRAPTDEAPEAIAAPAPAPPPRVIVVPQAAPPPNTASRPERAPADAPPSAAATGQPVPPPARPADADVLPAPPGALAQAPADEPELPPVAVLDAASRSALPPLKLTMHVYADDPARRFAIVDGQRVGEGARLGAAVVAQIRRDGVVIEVDGRRLLLPKP